MKIHIENIKNPLGDEGCPPGDERDPPESKPAFFV